MTENAGKSARLHGIVIWPVRVVTSYYGYDGEITAAKEFDLPVPPCVGLVIEDGNVLIEIATGDVRFDAVNGVVNVFADFDARGLGYTKWFDVLESSGWDIIESFGR